MNNIHSSSVPNEISENKILWQDQINTLQSIVDQLNNLVINPKAIGQLSQAIIIKKKSEILELIKEINSDIKKLKSEQEIIWQKVYSI